MNADYAEGEEYVKGAIVPGELADLVGLSADNFQIDAAEIDSTEIEMTVFDGKVIYERR